MKNLEKIIATMNEIISECDNERVRKAYERFVRMTQGKLKTMLEYQRAWALSELAKREGVDLVYNERTRLYYLHMTDAPRAYQDEHGCAMTHYEVCSASEISEDLYGCLDFAKKVFCGKYKNNPVFADVISRLSA